LTAESGESEQDKFSIINEVNDDVTTEQLARDIVDVLEDNGFVGNQKNTHFYKTSIITDFSIRELGENENDN
jgi:hypothetical protein